MKGSYYGMEGNKGNYWISRRLKEDVFVISEPL